MIAELPRRLRRNHALEHATINLLTQKHPQTHIIGLSRPLGFTLYTDLVTADVVEAVTEALRRLKAGQRELALHPNCGTGLLAAAAMTTLGTLIGLGSSRQPARQRLGRLPGTLLLNALLLVLARPVGLWLQANVTVDASVNAAEISSVFTSDQGKLRQINVNIRYV